MIVHSVTFKDSNKQFLFYDKYSCLEYIKSKYQDIIDVDNLIMEDININGRQIIYGIFDYSHNGYLGYYHNESDAKIKLNDCLTYKVAYEDLSFTEFKIDSYKLLYKEKIVSIIHPIILQ